MPRQYRHNRRQGGKVFRVLEFGLALYVCCACRPVVAAEAAIRRMDFGAFSPAGGLLLGEHYASCGKLDSGAESLATDDDTWVFRGVAAWGLWMRSLDSDADGIADDHDWDDDNDGLLDRDEISRLLSVGASTDSKLADSDGDGWDDRVELLRGYDPLDPDAILRIDSIRKTPQGVEISWSGRAGEAYRIRAMADTGESLNECWVADAGQTDVSSAPTGSMVTGTFVDSSKYGNVRAVLYRIEYTEPIDGGTR